MERTTRARSARAAPLLLAGLVGLALPAWAETPPEWVDAVGADLVGGRAGLLPPPLPRPEERPADAAAGGAGGDAQDAGAHRGEGAAGDEHEGWGGSGRWLGEGEPGLGLTQPERPPFAEPLLLTAHTGVHLLTGPLGRLTGPGQQVGVTLHLRPLAGAQVEVGYEASRTPLRPDLAEHGALWRHQLGALVTAGPVLEVARVRPFLGAGVGLAAVGPGERAPVALRHGLLLEVPFAGGVEWRLGGVTTGARVTWRLLLGEDVLGAREVGAPRSGALGASLMVGGSL